MSRNIEYFDQPDRRQQQVPIAPDQERRLSERVSILEIQVDSHAAKLENNQEMLIKFFDRFDDHLVKQADQNKSLETTLVKVSTTVDNLASEISRTNATMEDFTIKMDSTSRKVNQWDTIAKTLIKVATIASIVVGAAWTVYTYVDSKPSVQPNTNQGIHLDH